MRRHDDATITLRRCHPTLRPSSTAPSRRSVVAAFLLALLLAACGSGTSSSSASRAPTPTPTVKPPVTYVALGASDAVGVGADDPNTQGYVPRIIARLPKGSAALNLGINGATLHEALTQELPDAVNAQPTIITVWLVGNDFRDCTPLTQYAADLDALLTQLHQRTHAQIFAANTPQMGALPYFQQGAPGGGACFAGASPRQVNDLAARWNQAINPIITRDGAVLVDLYSSDLASHPDYVSQDGFHPSSAGYARLADLFWAQITAHHAVPAG